MTFDLSEQAQHAYDQDGRIMVLGGPGSGKTTLSLLKTQRLIPSLQPGQSILFLSFSRAAVRQVLNRCRDVLSADERSRITVQTYHAFCMDILRAHGRLLTGAPARILFPDKEKVAKAGHEGEWVDERDRLAGEGIYAFDNFAGGASELLTRVSKVAELVADRFPIIILDEFQDTSDSQWALVQALGERSELMVLADPDQRIFEYDDRVDPERLNHVREVLQPVEFDLGGDNHRSPDAGILQFADAVLHNRELPETDDVKVLSVWPNQLDSATHAACVWLYSQLKKAGIGRPSIVVLARTNAMVSDISSWISSPHHFNNADYKPVSHDVLWDAEISAAAAQVIASMLEWPECGATENAARTLAAVADFYEVKSAAATNGPIKSALATRDSYRSNAAAIRAGKVVRPKGAKHIVEAATNGLILFGEPRADWIAARSILEGADGLSEIVQAARFVRLFGATDEIGGRLSEQWDRSGTYGRATDLVRRTLEQGKLATEQREPQGFVLMNMHKSKGKEFDGVVIVEGAHRSVFFSDREESPHLATRRLLRVAITRARHKVIIVRPVRAAPLTGG